MSDGAYCPDCKRYQCLCALTEEALQMRRERDEALATLSQVAEERDEARKQERFLFLKHAALSQGLRVIEIQRDQARRLALQHLLEAWGDNPIVLKDRFELNPWLKEIYYADTPREVSLSLCPTPGGDSDEEREGSGTG